MKKVNSILIVDDDYVSAWITKDAIDSLNPSAKVDIVYDGLQALNFLEKHCLACLLPDCSFCPAIIFLDLNMPVLDGFEFLEEFKRKYASIAHEFSIYILTTSSYPKDIEKAEFFNVTGFVTKPLKEETIRDIFIKLSK